MTKIVDLMLWILTFPVAFLFAYAINLLTAIILSKILGDLSQPVFPFLEALLFPFTFNFILIWSSYRMMPANPIQKWKIVMIFFFILTLLNIITIFINPLDNPVSTILRAIMSTLGGIAGLIIVHGRIIKDLKKLEDYLSNQKDFGQEVADALNRNLKKGL